MQSERLQYHPASIDDAEFFLALFNTPKWLKFIGDRQVHSVAAAKQYISNRMLNHFEEHGYGAYVVSLKGSGEKIGNVGLYNRPGLDSPDIGFAFLPQYEQKGYGYEAATWLLERAFKELKLPEVCAITIEENIASQRLIEKLGLEPKGKTKLPDDEDELLLYGIAKEQYSKEKS